MSPHELTRVILSWPRLLAERQDLAATAGVRRSWVQLAKTGSFTSNRYGKFSITKQDLSQMLSNFASITPQAPTELPIDYDHLSMDPKKPGDGIAAGWMKQLELRDNGEQLWAEVEWTVPGAERVENKEYRFVSPSFVKDHTHKDGKKIGTTLLAAAITNHPFLEGMEALSLYSCSTVGELDWSNPAHFDLSAHEIFDLSEVGQRVMIAPGHARTMDETGGTFEIVEVVGQGDDAFIVLKDANGVLHKWFRSTELLPASATPMPGGPNLQPGVPNAEIPPGTPGVPPAPAHPEVAAQIEAAAAEAGEKAAALGASPEEQAAAAEAAREEATAAAAAVAPPAGADGVAIAGQATLDADGKPVDGQLVVAGKKGDPTDDEADAADDAADDKDEEGAAVGAVAAKTGAPGAEGTPLKKAVSALLGAQPNKPAVKPPVKKVTNMSTKFMLRNDKDEEVEVTADQLAAAGIRVVPDGSTVIGTEELGVLNGKVTSLSAQVETLATTSAASVKKAVTMELKAELDRLSNGGFILKTNRDYAEKKFGAATDLADFHEWAAQFTTVIVHLNREHGTGADANEPAGEAAGKQILTLANTIARERGISLRDAMIQASAQLPAAAEAYRESFNTH